MTTWTEVQMYVSFHRMPYSIIRFLNKKAWMIEHVSGKIVATTVNEAEKWLKG